MQKKPLAQLPSVTQVFGQLGEAPLHTYGEQDGAPMPPDTWLVHVPGVALQVWQAPAQALVQQTPSAVHWFDAHATALVQAAPGACFGAQVVPAQ